MLGYIYKKLDLQSVVKRSLMTNCCLYQAGQLPAACCFHAHINCVLCVDVFLAHALCKISLSKLRIRVGCAFSFHVLGPELP